MLLLVIGALVLALLLFAGVRVWIALKRVRYARTVVASIAIVVFLWGGLEVGLVPGSTPYRMYGFSEELFGEGFLFTGAPKLSFESERSFNGDGYSIVVRDLPMALGKWLSHPPPEFLSAYPRRPSYRAEWNSTRWRNTPVPIQELQYLMFAVSGPQETAEGVAAMKLLEELASEPGSYFSYLYKEGAGYVANIDFFLVSEKHKCFIAVNNNT